MDKHLDSKHSIKIGALQNACVWNYGNILKVDIFNSLSSYYNFYLSFLVSSFNRLNNRYTVVDVWGRNKFLQRFNLQKKI